MTENNANNPSNPHPNRSHHEEKIAKDLFSVFHHRQEELKSKYGLDGGLNEEEVKLLKNLQTLELTYYGLAASLGTFWLLRGARGLLTRRLAARRFQQQNPPTGYSTDGGKTFSPFHNTPPPNNNLSPPPPPPPLQPTRFQLLFGVILDAACGSLVGVALDDYWADRPSVQKRFLETPLKAGRSNIADQFCPSLIEAYQKQWKIATATESKERVEPLYQEKNTRGSLTILPKGTSDSIPASMHQDMLKNPQNVDLQILVGFVQNCQKRQALEQRIRQERRLGPNAAVAIPEPGVVATSDSSLSGDVSHETSSGDFYEGENFRSSGEDEDWTQEVAGSFVSDQEDDS